MNRAKQLKKLEKSLFNLVEVLRHDEGCQWLNHFERNLQDAKNISPEDQESLNQLSGSITSVYAGMGSFNDYVPACWKNNKEMKYYTLHSGEVYENAIELRVVGRR